MSARDSESGSSTYKGGSGRAGGLGNGGIGGGMGGGGMGGGAGRNGGIGSRTGLTTGNRMFGGTATGRSGGLAWNPGAWGVRPQPTVTQGPLSGVRRPVSVPVPAAVPGVNPVPETVPQSVLPNIPRTYVPSRIRQVFDSTPWMTPTPSGPWPGQANSPQGPDALANDISTLMDHRNTTPRKLGGMTGGLGIPGYVTNRVPGYGGTLSNKNSGRGWGGWNSLGFN